MSGMKFQHTSTYDAPAAEVFAMLTDPARREKVGAAQNVVSSTVTVTQAVGAAWLEGDR